MRVRCLIEAPPENLQLAISAKGKNITCNYLHYLHQSYELQVQFQLHGQEHPSIGKRESRQDRHFVFLNKIIDVATIIIFLNTYRHDYICLKVDSLFIDALLAPQSGALRISAYRDFHPIHPTYSFRAFKPFYSDQKQCM